MAWPRLRRNGPVNYSRTGLKVEHLKSVLADGEWRPLSWIVAELSRFVSPEAAIRFLKLERRGEVALDQIAVGKKRIIEHRLKHCSTPWKSRPNPLLERRHGATQDEYRLRTKHESKEDTSGEDQA